MTATVLLGGAAEHLKDAIRCGLHLAGQLDVDLTGLCVMPDPALRAVYVSGGDMVAVGPSAIASMQAAQDGHLGNLRTLFGEETKASASKTNAAFVHKQGHETAHFEHAALFSDALILPRVASDSNHALNPAFEHILMQARLPIVMAGTTAMTTDTCVIAWDSSPISARAVRLHWPLISAHKRVVIAHNPGKLRIGAPHIHDAAVQDLEQKLSTLGLAVETRRIDGKVSEALLHTAQDVKASMIIMGAYGRNRLGELIFGGTTSALLHAKTAPTLALCH